MKRILTYGDSNTWGFDPETWGSVPMTLERYPEDIRWTGLLQKALGKGALVLEEGLCGRTTAFDDEECDGRNGLMALPTIILSQTPSLTTRSSSRAFSKRKKAQAKSKSIPTTTAATRSPMWQRCCQVF